MGEGNLKDFYFGKTILVTGATGFIGRLLVAKLLRLGNVKEILICSRPKKGKSNEERLNSIFNGFLFENVAKFDKTFKSKLRIMNCDLELKDLGISSDDKKYIKSNVEIIIHAAATVRFDELLKKAIQINVYGTKSFLDLALETENLQSFVHISTAFTQCPLEHIKETFYEPPLEYHTALCMVESLSDDQIDSLTPKLIAPWPNTYTFTKAIAEDLVRQYSNQLPIGIIRPSIGKHT